MDLRWIEARSTEGALTFPSLAREPRQEEGRESRGSKNPEKKSNARAKAKNTSNNTITEFSHVMSKALASERAHEEGEKLLHRSLAH
jgi:hypothetical protein